MERDGTTYCDRHSKVESALRCSRCEAYICPKCAVLTTVGYRCPDCGSEKSAVATLGLPRLILGSLIGFAAGFVSAFFVPRFLGLFLIFAGAILGGFVGRAIRKAIGNKSSVAVGGFTALGFIVGALARPMLAALGAAAEGFEMGQVFQVLFSQPWTLVFAVVAAVVAWSQLR